MSGSFYTLRGAASPCGVLTPTEAVARRSEAERPRKQAMAGPAERVAESRTRDCLIGQGSPAM